MLKRIGPAVLCLALAACGKSDSSGGSSGGGGGGSASGGGGGTATAQNGGATPEEAFKLLNDTAKASDWKGMFAVIHPDDHDMMLFGLTFGAAFAGMGAKDPKAVEDEAKAIFAKHKVPEKKEGEAEKIDMNDKAKMREKLKEMFKDVPDKSALAGDLIGFMKKHSDKDGDFMDFGGTLKDVKTDGDKATGTIERTGGKTSPVQFGKLNGRWYMKLED